jgi:hypothetical protein
MEEGKVERTRKRQGKKKKKIIKLTNHSEIKIEVRTGKETALKISEMSINVKGSSL